MYFFFSLKCNFPDNQVYKIQIVSIHDKVNSMVLLIHNIFIQRLKNRYNKACVLCLTILKILFNPYNNSERCQRTSVVILTLGDKENTAQFNCVSQSTSFKLQ